MTQKKYTPILRQVADALVDMSTFVEEVRDKTWAIVLSLLAAISFVTGAVFFAPVSPYSQGAALFFQSASIWMALLLLGLVLGSRLTAQSFLGIALASGFLLISIGVTFVMPQAIRHGFNDYVLEGSWAVYGQMVLLSYVPGLTLSIIGRVARRKLHGY